MSAADRKIFTGLITDQADGGPNGLCMQLAATVPFARKADLILHELEV